MAANVVSDLENRAKDVNPLPRSQQCPRPREDKLIAELASGKTVSAALRAAGFHQNSTSLRQRLQPDGDLRKRLITVLKSADITSQRVANRLSSKLDASKTLTIAGNSFTQDDNDAQLRAVEQSVKLLQLAGELPTPLALEGSSSTITVNVMNLNVRE